MQYVWQNPGLQVLSFVVNSFYICSKYGKLCYCQVITLASCMNFMCTSFLLCTNGNIHSSLNHRIIVLWYTSSYDSDVIFFQFIRVKNVMILTMSVKQFPMWQIASLPWKESRPRNAYGFFAWDHRIVSSTTFMCRSLTQALSVYIPRAYCSLFCV